MEVTLKRDIEKKLENQYSFRLHDAQKQHETRLNELKARERTVLDRLTKQKSELEEKSREMGEQERRMINKYEERLQEL